MEPPRGRRRCPFLRLRLRLLPLLLLLLQGSVLFKAHALDVEVKDEENVTCLFAKWATNLSITYESTANENKSIAFMFPESVRYDGSTCGNDTYGPILAMEFGDGHLWTIRFAKAADTYQGSISFTYNTNDTELFPDAKRQGPVTTLANFPVQPVKLYTVFTCRNMESVEFDNVTQDFWNITLQAFLEDGALSNKRTLCDKDAAITVVSGTVPTARAAAGNATTAASNATTAAGNAATTTANTTAEPTPSPSETPITGNYSLKNGSTACLLAKLGLQLNITQKVPVIINFNPSTTAASGTCGSSVAILTLKDGGNRVNFLFAMKNETTDRFSLKEVNITVVDPQNGTLSAANRSLDYWEASLGSSYMCRKEETLVVTSGYRMNVFDLQVQPFDVKDNEYSIAEDCSPEAVNYFVLIMVGAALLGLVALVFLAFSGRRRAAPNAGYEPF